MSPDQQFWIGLALAIPLSILGNLVTPSIQKNISIRFESYAKRRRELQARERARLDVFVNNPVRLQSYMLMTLIIATMLGSAIGVFTALMFILGTISEGGVGTVLAQGLSVFGGLMVTKICLDATGTVAKVRHIEKASHEQRN